MEQIADDGSSRVLGSEGGGGGRGVGGGRLSGGGGAGPVRPPRHPEAVPECLLGALLPPVRLSCVPFGFSPPGSAKGGGSSSGRRLFGAEGFPRVGINEAGQPEVDGGAADGVEGGWAVSTVALLLL